MAEVKENSELKYIIFFMAVGTCIGNMFLAGRIKNIMNVKIPNVPRGAASATTGKTNAQTKAESHSSQYKQNKSDNYDDRKQDTWNEYVRRKQTALQEPNKYPHWLLDDPRNSHYLRTLNLWPVPTTYELFLSQLKTNYRSLAKNYHPDALPVGIDPTLRSASAKKFQEISLAYQQMLSITRLQAKKRQQSPSTDE